MEGWGVVELSVGEEDDFGFWASVGEGCGEFEGFLYIGGGGPGVDLRDGFVEGGFVGLEGPRDGGNDAGGFDDDGAVVGRHVIDELVCVIERAFDAGSAMGVGACAGGHGCAGVDDDDGVSRGGVVVIGARIHEGQGDESENGHEDEKTDESPEPVVPPSVGGGDDVAPEPEVGDLDGAPSDAQEIEDSDECRADQEDGEKGRRRVSVENHFRNPPARKTVRTISSNGVETGVLK